ncbi:Uncharacterized protein BP5553_00581 [Venustampulla echinocandica]|uniref:Uncharacterized protein n=1 Tax=Venustampulla echinocandica TaxID=2656787 RepID=A0A370TYK5_9HELO|nr:Uncharacterized protein BP5553_00581 [Venustampulla echinocandica]RDL40602.1 Uncharacterized protein BP5553_00581 [Venustampulla echinocandica]
MAPPSAGWTSYDGWDYNGMKERLESFMRIVNKLLLVEHAQLITSQSVSISEPFSAGQFWYCFELLAADGRLIIARCEVETMKFLAENATISSPKLYAYEGLGSQRAADVGAAYMLIEGFYGNTLQDVQYKIYELPISKQEHIITQWTSIQAELASFTFPQIGSIAHFSKDKGAMIGKLSTAVADSLPADGPFADIWDYFAAIAEVKFRQACKNDTTDDSSNNFAKLGPFIFKDICPFHFNHMDMGMQNILVDQDFNFFAIIDWEFAQTAPWEVNHYPMPFPLISPDAETECILHDPDHIAHHNVSRQVAARSLYRQKFRDAEQALDSRGRSLRKSIADTLDGPASRIYAILGKPDVFDGMEEELTYEMVRLAYGFDDEEVKEYLHKMDAKMMGQ